jgi:hypothetical protein
MRLTQRLAILPLLALALSTAACGEEAIADGSDTGGTSDAAGGALLPLVDGAIWTYQVEAGSLSTTSEALAQGEDSDTFVLTEGNDETTLTRSGTQTMRISEVDKSGDAIEALIDYDPGFVRADEDWASAADGDTFDYAFTETTTDANGENAVEEDRAHTFTVISTSEEVETTAGTFTTVHVRRETTVGAKAGNVVEYWYAPGIGRVQEYRHANGGLDIEQEWQRLHYYTIPESGE